MRRYILYLISIHLLILMASCMDDMAVCQEDIDSDGKITFTVGMSLPGLQSQPTRGILDGFEDNPDGTYLEALNFYVFVFEDNGAPQVNFLRELAYGSDITVHKADEEGGSFVKFKVRLNGTSENAILHIVATADSETFESQLKSVPDRSELGIFAGASGLYTSDHEAYWKRIELDSPIVNDEEIKTSISQKLSRVRMVRNFLRVTLRAADPDDAEDKAKYEGIVLNGFQVDAFLISNAIDKGYVAAYNENLGDDNRAGFVEFEETDDQGALTGRMRSYRDLIEKENYVPERHPASVRLNPDDNTSWVTDFDTNGNMASKYMFERSLQDVNKTFVIVKGHYGDDPTPKYFKLDIGAIFKGTAEPDPNSAYGYFETFQLLRNISYDIVITKVAPGIGHSSVQGALGAPPANNISASIETRPIKIISDGIDRMSVNETTYVIIDDDEGNPVPDEADLKWLYESNYYTGPKVYASEEVKWNYPGYEFKFEGGVDPNGIIASWGNGSTTTPNHNEAKDFGDNWRGFTVKFTKPDNITRQKTIRFYKPYGLSRDITFIMHKRWEFVNRSPEKYPSNVEVYPGSYSFLEETMPYETMDELREALAAGNYNIEAGYVGSQRGAQLTVMFELPEDLPEAIFPLDFKIGANRQNIENAYIGNAVATWGASMFEEEDPIGVNRMQFVKTVTWADYNQHKVVCARFLTTTDVLNELTSETEVYENTISTTKVKVENPYFTLGYDDFERQAHVDTIDPTRTYWYWNFTYPEWATYFSTYYGKSDDPFSLNNLHFNIYGYTKGSTSFGNYMSIGQNDPESPKEADSSIDKPDLYFPVDFSIDDYNGGTLNIFASVDKGRDNIRVTGRNGLGVANRWGADLFDRDVHAGVVLNNDNTIELSCTNGNWRLTQEGTGGNSAINPPGKGNPRDPQYVQFSLADVPSGSQVKEIRIWSERTDSFSTASYDYVLKAGKTRYYSVEFTLTPKQ